jgi:hypothetical protein
MRQIVAVFALLLIATVAVWAAGCPMSAKCPVDDAQSFLVSTEYSGIVAVGVYEHTTNTGQVHRFRVRCN